jgi:hypothetical protein
MRHTSGDLLEELWDALTHAWRSCSSGSRAVRAAWKNVEWAKRVEVTHGPSGWHVHIHALLFVPVGFDPEPLGRVTFDAWSAALQGAGLEAPLEGPGVDCRRLDLRQASRDVADYVSKGSYSAPAEEARMAALEVASSAKRARGVNRTPFAILADFVLLGQAEDAELWRTWEQVSFRRRAMTWSAGTRDRLVGDQELDDVSAAQESDGADQVVAVIRPEVWPSVSARPRLAQKLLAVVELHEGRDGSHLAVAAILAQAGFPDAVAGPPREQESPP